MTETHLKFPHVKFIYVWNSTKDGVTKQEYASNSQLFKEEPTLEEKVKMMEHGISQLSSRAENGEVFTNFFAQFQDQKPTGWVLQWFNHYTLDVGQTDEEVLASFEAFVSECEDNPEYKEFVGNKTLMGAEDRWRWRGEHNPNGNDYPAPCRCKACKEHGLIRINH